MTDTADRLLDQALAAANADDHTTALRLLKDGAAQHPDHAAIAYQLGAEFAHLELFDAAEAQMTRALGLDAELHAARFHLGLLQITRSRFDEAIATWQALDALPDDHALRLYKQAFEILAEDRFEPARVLLTRGLAARGSTPALDRDMRTLLARLPPG
ncbi:MAG: hypothetical protein KDE68_01660 [Rhodocyclaceae bacterium]|nr:hypothetical protein [Rhodocyclaceae bacterium]